MDTGRGGGGYLVCCGGGWCCGGRPDVPGPWTVTPSPLPEVCRGIVACWAMGLVRFASFACEGGPVVGLPGPRLVLWGSFLCKWGPDTGSPGLAL